MDDYSSLREQIGQDLDTLHRTENPKSQASAGRRHHQGRSGQARHRDPLAHFQEKSTPIFCPEMRQNKSACHARRLYQGRHPPDAALVYLAELHHPHSPHPGPDPGPRAIKSLSAKDPFLTARRAMAGCRLKAGRTEERFPPRLYFSSFASAFLAFSSINSYHMAFMTAKMAARGRPSSQAKYHMFDLLECVRYQ